VIGGRLPPCLRHASRLSKTIHLRSLSMLAISILGLFLIFMAVMNIIDFGRVD
jgi:hypothetical protein